ncbi:hypothetical protein DEAC_c14380 [Desulfosporosinus acididurans]|uniref:Uncharacterized protein n=1 Tax=Desulfosporosinus acididurans TaxID=476652 RepID=A0A0J1FTG8_9FIRM|nr:hypothetical protein [Desulfosporosinus acididurans]KLU66770.1 hypothetical protein DEAC_c14380 [Desulfosporosinus acididurans]
MATITLGTLRDLWENVSDWVKGVDTTSKPKVSSIQVGETTIATPLTGTKTVTATAAEVFAGASAKSGRSRMVIKNEDPALRFRIGSSSVTQQGGYPVEPGAAVELQFDPLVSVPTYAISEGASIQVSVWEV